LKDALNEIEIEDGQNSRRREILFAVCFSESYIIEWVRDEIFAGNIKGFVEKFASGRKFGGAYQIWTVILEKLKKEKLIPETVDLTAEPCWTEFRNLRYYRNELVHGAASLPEGNTLNYGKERLLPPSELSKLKPCWAIGVTIELVKCLHKAVGTSPPEWLCAS